MDIFASDVCKHMYKLNNRNNLDFVILKCLLYQVVQSISSHVTVASLI